MKTIPRIALYILFSLIYCFHVPTMYSQPLCEPGCLVNDNCGDLAPSGGLCAGSSTFFCEGDTVCVENNSVPSSFDEWVVWWDDGTCDTYPNTVSVATHIYVVAEDTCLNNIAGLAKSINIKNIKYCGPDDDYSLNCVTTYIIIKVNPLAIFSEPEAICKDQEVCFINATCPNADTVTYQWFVDNTLVSETIDLCYTFPATGNYTVCLEATNECGIGSTCHSVNVIDVPIAQSDASYDSDSCVSSLLVLNDETSGPASISWQVIEGLDYQFASSNEVDLPDTTLILHSVDTFLIMHIADNFCGADTSYLEIPTYDIPGVLLIPPADSCGSYTYLPDVSYSGSIDSVKWVVNSGPDTICGLNPEIPLDVGIHSIQAIAAGPCGTLIASVSVTVNGSDSIAFDPVEILCSDSDPVQLAVSSISTGDYIPLNSGMISCINDAFIENDSFNPASAGAGMYTICFETNTGDCPSTTSIDIEVLEGAVVDVGGPVELCSDAGEYQISFSPTGGQWTGTGITDEDNGIFDPAIAGDGIHLLEYIYGDSTGCTNYKTKEIEVFTSPLLSANDVTICQADMDFDVAELAALNFPSSDTNLTCFINGVEGCQFNPNLLGIGSYEVVFLYAVLQSCSTTDTISLEITELTLVQASPDTTVCSGETLVLTAMPSFCANWPAQPNISTDGEVDTDGFTGAQTFTVTCNEGTECETNDDVVVTVVGESAQVPTEDWICSTQNSYTLPAGLPVDGEWSGPSLMGNEVNVSGLPAGQDFTYDYTVAYLPDACETDSFVLHVEAPPIAEFSNPEIACKGDEIQFENLTTGAVFFLWDFGNDSTSSLENPVVIYEETGDYIITLEAWTTHPLTGDLLCFDTYSGSIHISEPPQNVEIGANTTVGCEPLEIDFSNLSFGENMNYLWCMVNVDTLEEIDPGPIIFEQIEIDTTFYDVILKGWNDCDTLFDTIQIIVLPSPTAGFGIQFDEPCSGGELILNNLSVGNPLNNTWTITNITLGSPPEIFNSFNVPPLTVFASDTAEATVIIQLETSNACGTSVFVDSVIVLPSPIIAQMSFSEEQVCVGEALVLIDISTPGTIPEWEITQSNGEVFFFIGDTVNFIPTVAGTFTVLLYAHGCGYDTISLEFEAMPLPPLSVSYTSAALCDDIPVHFEIDSPGNGIILQYGDGTSTDLHNSEHIYPSTGTFQLSAIAQTPFGCQMEWTDSLIIAENPSDLAMTFTDEICAGTTADFAATGIGVQSWEWIFCDTCFRSGASVTYAFDTFGIQTVQLIGVSPLGCRDTIAAPFFVLTTPQAIIDEEVIRDCTPAEVVFNSLSLDATGIEWFNNGVPVSADNSITISVANEGQLMVQLIATNGNICFDTAFASIPIFASPSFTVAQEANCTVAEGTIVSIETSTDNFASIFGTLYEGDGNLHQNVPAGDYVVEVISPNGCQTEAEITVIPVQELLIQLEQYLFDIDLGEEVQLQVISNLSDVTYSWSPAADLNNPDIFNPVTSPYISTFYAVEVTDARSCVKYDTAYVQVNIDRENNVFIPNTFTPNNDGPNDIFRIRSQNPGLVGITSFEIFDRNGEKVFEAYDCQPETSACGWDGNFKGQKAEMGLYIWMAELEFIDGIKTNLRGGVTLIR